MARVWGVVALTMMLANGASAQEGSARLNRFTASELPMDDFGISRPVVDAHLRFGVQVHLDYANDPLVWERTRGDGDTEEYAIVGHQLDAQVGLSLSFFDRFAFFASLPVTAVMQGDDEERLAHAGLVTPDGPGLGDVAFGARLRIWGEHDDVFAIGLNATALFPTAGEQRFRGDAGFGFRPELAAEFRPLGARIALNVGALVRENAAEANTNLEFRDELTFGLGVMVPVWRDPHHHDTWLEIHAQTYGSTAFEDFFGRGSTPLEVIGGLKFFHRSGFTTGLAAGPGLTRGLGSPDVRVIGMLAYTTRPEAGEADEEPVADADGDGVPDDQDQCATEAEDLDGFHDDDGCPEPDNDEDGIHDDHDECPREPETANGFEDDDGCPDDVSDTDGDGLPDHEDRCPTEPEDHDDFRDSDGCADVDNDGDGVVDAMDRCIDTVGPPENRGCPDTDRDLDGVFDRLDNCPDETGEPEFNGCRRRQRVVIQGDRLEILDRVFFRTNSHRIRRRSFPLLRNVANVLMAHPEIERVTIEGHTDSRGERAHNIELSQRRADEVVRFLVESGVHPARLNARGLGPDRPLVPDASNRTEHAQNRRVEFHIEGGAPEGVEQAESAAGADTVDR